MMSDAGKGLMTYLQAQRPSLGWYKDGLEQSEFMAKCAAGHEFCMKKMQEALTVGKNPEEIEMTYGVDEKTPSKA